MDVDTYLRSPEQPLITKNWRFLGFINDVGEALRSFLPKSLYGSSTRAYNGMVGSYVVTGAYAVAAVYYDNRAQSDALTAPTAPSRTAEEVKALLTSRTLDNAAWHTLATVTITPLVVIPAVKVGAKRVFARLGAGSASLREKVLPAAVAILAIPAVVSPVDNACTAAFNCVRAKPEPYHWTGYWEALNDHGGGSGGHGAGSGGHGSAPPQLK